MQTQYNVHYRLKWGPADWIWHSNVMQRTYLFPCTCNNTESIKDCLPETWPQTRMPKVAAKPKAKLTVRNMPWEPPLKTSWATAPQPNIWKESQKASSHWVPSTCLDISIKFSAKVARSMYEKTPEDALDIRDLKYPMTNFFRPFSLSVSYKNHERCAFGAWSANQGQTEWWNEAVWSLSVKLDELYSELNELYCVHDGTQEHSILYVEKGHCVDLDWGRTLCCCCCPADSSWKEKETKSSFRFEWGKNLTRPLKTRWINRMCGL